MNRSLSYASLVLLGIGELLGGGIYSILTEAAPLSGTLTWVSFLISSGLALLTVLSIASLSSRRPDCSGVPGCVRHATGSRYLGFLAGVCQIAAYMLGLSATAILFCHNNLVASLGLPLGVTVLAFLGVIDLINRTDVLLTAFSASICTVVEASGVVIVIIAGVWHVFFGPGVHAASLLSDASVTPTSFIRSIPLTFFSFGGITSLYAAVEEAANARQIAPAMILQLLIVTALYVAVSVAVSLVLGPELHNSQDALLDTVGIGLPQFPAFAFDLIKLFAGFNTSLGIHYALSRMVMGMARDGELPSALSKLDGSALIPVHASSFVTVLGVALSLGTNVFEVVSNATLFLLALYFLGDISLCLTHHEAIDGSFEVPISVPRLGASVNFLFILYFMIFEFSSSRFVPALLLGSSLLHLVARASS